MNIKDIGTFISAGNAIFSLSNERTGKVITYRVKRHRDFEEGRRQWSVSVRFRSEGEEAFGYLGMIKNRSFNHTMFSMTDEESDNFSLFDWFFLQVIREKELPWHILFDHTGRCGKCNRLLTDPVSIETGLGPICAASL